MFGPNKNYQNHRSEESQKLIADVKSRIEELTKNEYDILFVPGSSSMGMELILGDLSTFFELDPTPGHGKFRARWRDISRMYRHRKTIGFYGSGGHDHYGTGHGFNHQPRLTVKCAFETSISYFSPGPAGILDAVSSWPYYPIPDQTNIFITCSNKQLGAGPGISIIGVRKSFWEKFQSPQALGPYFGLHHLKDNPIPFTMPIDIFAKMKESLTDSALQAVNNDIAANSKIITDCFDREDIVGNLVAPTISIKKEAIPLELAKRWHLYTSKSAVEGPTYQFFTYARETYYFLTFAEELKQWA